MKRESMQGIILEYQNHRPDIDSSVFIAPNACVIGDVVIKANASIWFNAVLRADEVSIRIGSRTNVQDGVIIHGDAGQDVVIGNNVTIGHGTIIHGCVIEDGALIGMGAVVLDGAVIERGALVAAGAVVGPGKRVSANTLWAGVPAKQIRELDVESAASLLDNAEHYTQQSLIYQRAAEPRMVSDQ